MWDENPEQEKRDFNRFREQMERVREERMRCTRFKPLYIVIPDEGIIIDCPCHPQGHFIAPPPKPVLGLNNTGKVLAWRI